MSTTPAATTSLYESGASNMDILDKIGDEVLTEHPSAATDTGSPASGTGVTDAAVTTPPGDTPAAEAPVRPEWFETAPQEYKDLFAQKNISEAHRQWLEKTYGELSSFKSSPIGTPESVQELTELFPGGLEDIREAHTAAQQFRTEMEQFNSGDPGQQTELLANLIQQNPDAFVSLIGSASDLIKQTLRDDYTAFASNLAHDHLESMTDGKFGQFFDSIVGRAREYSQLAESNPEAAAKLASKLAGDALTIADWWGTAKNKLGYGEKTAPAAGGRQPVTSINRADDREVQLATKEANLWSSNYMLKHDNTVNPMISQALKTELTARKMTDLPQNWQNRVLQSVAEGIKANLASDKTYLALENRIYRHNDAKDPRKWDNSDTASRTLLQAVKQRAEKLVPSLLKRALDDLSSLRGTPVKPNQPGAATRSSATAATAGAATGDWEADLKAGKITNAEAIQRITGL